MMMENGNDKLDKLVKYILHISDGEEHPAFKLGRIREASVAMLKEGNILDLKSLSDSLRPAIDELESRIQKIEDQGIWVHIRPMHYDGKLRIEVELQEEPKVVSA